MTIFISHTAVLISAPSIAACPEFFSSPDVCTMPAFISLASCSIGGTPIPPPIRNAFFPGCTVKPFPRGPKILTLSPLTSFENSSVPVPSPVTRYTRRMVSSSLFMPQRLIGRGSSLLLSFE